jgi:hypothetical protein
LSFWPLLESLFPSFFAPTSSHSWGTFQSL